MTKRYFHDAGASPFSQLFSSLKKDDLVLLGLFLFLIGEGCDDKELLVMLGVLFFSDKRSSDKGIVSQLESFFNKKL